jgi:hypothetical protein
MAVDETRRYELHEAARRTLGAAPGDTLMEMLPPVGWADVTTKTDLALTKRDLESQIQVLRSDVQSMVLASEHRLIFWIIGSLAAGLTIATTVARSI